MGGYRHFTLLRLLLALMVVVGHSKLLSGTNEPPFPYNLADAGVDSFFAVSGFLITGSYERRHFVIGDGPLRSSIEATGARVTGWLSAEDVQREQEHALSDLP